MHRFLIGVLLALSSPMLSADQGEAVLHLPPESLAQWYRPENKRDVWLHTMFALRREMQAIAEYAALEDEKRLRKWLDRLEKDYRRIGEMVPEWRDELETELIAKMKRAGSAQELARLQRKLRKESCQSCHREYKLVAALLYRTPDFDRVRVEDGESMEEESYSDVMRRLTLLVNRIKVGSEDGRKQAALDALQGLESRLTDLGTSCESCHKQERSRERILGKVSQEYLGKVRQGLEKGDHKQVGRNLGGFAVRACADCHAIHRLQSGLRRELLRQGGRLSD